MYDQDLSLFVEFADTISSRDVVSGPPTNIVLVRSILGDLNKMHGARVKFENTKISHKQCVNSIQELSVIPTQKN